jgi:MFS transporter, DHA1 family, multidrug resistance protein
MNRTAMVYLVSLAAFLGPFMQTIYTPILPEVTGDFCCFFAFNEFNP